MARLAHVHAPAPCSRESAGHFRTAVFRSLCAMPNWNIRVLVITLSSLSASEFKLKVGLVIIVCLVYLVLGCSSNVSKTASTHKPLWCGKTFRYLVFSQFYVCKIYSESTCSLITSTSLALHHDAFYNWMSWGKLLFLFTLKILSLIWQLYHCTAWLERCDLLLWFKPLQLSLLCLSCINIDVMAYVSKQ